MHSARITVMRNTKGLTLIELLVVINIVAILVGIGSVYYSEFGDEARCTEIYGVFPGIIRSQGLHAMQYNGYYTALDHDELRGRGVNLSEARYFRYSTFPDESGSFTIHADATDWAPTGWVEFSMKGSPQWSSDDVLIKREWLPY